MIEFDTTRFGRLRLPGDAVIRFPQALYGLEGRHAYCLLEHDRLGGFYWLQSIDDPATALIVTDPFLYYPEYEVEIPDDAAEGLKARTSSDVTVYTTVSLSDDRQGVHTNLLGPLVINHETKMGLQVVQQGDRYTCRHPLGRLAPEPERN